MPEIRESKVHSCVFQQKVVEQKFEPNPKKRCRCRKLVTFEQAKEAVKSGVAKWLVERRRRVEREQICAHCQDTEPNKATCHVCKSTGKTQFISILDDPGFDIVLLVHHTKSTRASTPRVPTIEANHILRAYVSTESRQRVQSALSEREAGNNEETGDMEFINLERTTPQQSRAAAARINEYGGLIQDQLHAIGAELKKKIVKGFQVQYETVEIGNPEPGEKRVVHPPGSITFADGSKNKSWWWEIEGRETDYGRAI